MGTTNRTMTIAAMTPPTTARASGMFAPPAMAIGVNPRMAESPVMRMGRSRMPAASTMASRAAPVQSFGAEVVGKLDEQHTETDDDVGHHDAAQLFFTPQLPPN